MTDPKAVTDLAAAGTGVATVFSWLPEVAALFTIAWYLWRFFEKIKEKWLKN